MITHVQLGADEDLSREILVVAGSIAPCVASFPDESEEQKNAIAILKRVYASLAPRGSALVKSQRIGPAAVEYFDVTSAFEGQPRAALRALCAPAAATGAPRGSFPVERPISRLWPETYQ